MRAAKWIRFAVLIAFSGLFFWLFYAQYWKHRECIAAAKSNCITPDGANLISGGAFWIVPALLFLLLGAITLGRTHR